MPSPTITDATTEIESVPLQLRSRAGAGFMILSCLAFAVMGAMVNAAQWREPQASPLVASFARIVVNLLLVVGMATSSGKLRDLFGDGRWSLWGRGCFGAISVMTSFAAIGAIGIGEASFLNASSGVFTATLAPVFLRQRNSLRVWIAIVGALFGLFLLFEPRFDDLHPWGRVLGLTSGLCASIAYLMISRAGRSNPPNVVIFYFCLVAVVFHLLVFAVLPTVWPSNLGTYALMAAAGVAGSVGQAFLTRAYQEAPAALNSAISYLLPVLNLVVSVLWFDRVPDTKAWVGASVVVVFGVMLPLVRLSNRERAA